MEQDLSGTRFDIFSEADLHNFSRISVNDSNSSLYADIQTTKRGDLGEPGLRENSNNCGRFE